MGLQLMGFQCTIAFNVLISIFIFFDMHSNIFINMPEIYAGFSMRNVCNTAVEFGQIRQCTVYFGIGAQFRFTAHS